MALKVERPGQDANGLITTDNLVKKPPVCHTCKLRKAGLFTLDPNGNPMCGDCAAQRGRPIP